MKPKKYLLLITLFLTTLIISACSSAIYSSTGWHGLAATSEKAYLAAGSQVYAVDITTGSENWRYPSKANARISFYAQPVLTEDGQLLVASYDHKLYSLNPATGSENWIFSGAKNRLIASPFVSQGMIFQPSTDHFIYAVNLKGQQVWSQETGGPIWAQPTGVPECGCIYVASMDHFVYSFDAATGRKLWQSQDLGGAMVGTPAISPDELFLYIGTFGNEMIALDANTGQYKWRFNTQDWVWSGPALHNGVLYFGDLSGNFYALNASDGTSVWQIKPQNAILSAPVIMDDIIYLTTEGDTLFMINTAGDVVNSKVIGGTIYTAPVDAGDTILVAPTNFDALLIALNKDGNQKWMFTPAK